MTSLAAACMRVLEQLAGVKALWMHIYERAMALGQRGEALAHACCEALVDRADDLVSHPQILQVRVNATTVVSSS